MEELPTNKVKHDSMKSSRRLTPDSLDLDASCKSKPSSFHKSLHPGQRRDLGGVTHQLSDKHRAFQRRDTPMTIITPGEKAKSLHPPKITEGLSEEVDES